MLKLLTFPPRHDKVLKINTGNLRNVLIEISPYISINIHSNL